MYKRQITDNADNAGAIAGMPAYSSTVTWDDSTAALSFDGALGSVALVDVRNEPELFNPAGAALRWIVDFTVPQSTIDTVHQEVAARAVASGDPDNKKYGAVSLNLIQRGYGANDGGQWKTQIVFGKVGEVYVPMPQCTVREAKPDPATTARRIKTPKAAPLELDPGEQYTIACGYDLSLIHI